MASPETLDFAQLLAPIPGENAAGGDLRDDDSPISIYHQIKDARTAARAAERQISMRDPNAIPPDWRPILRLAPPIISEKSKDLEIAAWLIEALLREHGIPGLRDGFRLVRELCEQYWDTLYPLPDEDGLETRVYPLAGLNGQDAEGTLITPILNIPITEQHDFGPYGKANLEQALELIKISDEEKRQARIADGAISKDMFDKAVAATSANFYRELVADLDECVAQFAQMCALLDEKCGRSSPPSSNIRNALQSVAETVRGISKTILAGDVSAAEGAAGEEAAGGEAPAEGGVRAAGAVVKVGNISNREEAFRVLLQVAEFFRRNEPHTPVSYALEQAVRWGRMPLPQLLAELITDQASRDALFRQVGIREEGS